MPTLRIRAVSLLAASFEDTLKMECDANLFLTPLAVRSALFALQNTLGPGDGSRLIGPVEDFRHLEGRIESIEKRKATVIGRAWPLEAGEVVFLKGKT